MSKACKLDYIPEELKQELEFKASLETIEEIQKWLLESGVEISKSAVGRKVKELRASSSIDREKIEKVANNILISLEQATKNQTLTINDCRLVSSTLKDIASSSRINKQIAKEFSERLPSRVNESGFNEEELSLIEKDQDANSANKQ